MSRAFNYLLVAILLIGVTQAQAADLQEVAATVTAMSVVDVQHRRLTSKLSWKPFPSYQDLSIRDSAGFEGKSPEIAHFPIP